MLNFGRTVSCKGTETHQSRIDIHIISQSEDVSLVEILFAMLLFVGWKLTCKRSSTKLCQEELSWFQIAKEHWLAYGDRNTCFYHIKALQRRCRKHVHSIKDVNGTWLTDALDIATTFRENFYQLYTSDIDVGESFTTFHSFPALFEVSKLSLAVELVVDEIKQATFEMAWKSSGSDDFPIGFFQTSWDIVGDVVCYFIMSLWRHIVQIVEINCMDICLIPKVPHASLLASFVALLYVMRFTRF